MYHCIRWHSLPVRDDDNQDGRDAADYDDDCESQQRPLGVADSLDSFLHARHHFRSSDLQDSSSRWEERLKLFIDVQEFPIQKPEEDKQMHTDL